MGKKSSLPKQPTLTFYLFHPGPIKGQEDWKAHTYSAVAHDFVAGTAHSGAMPSNIWDTKDFSGMIKDVARYLSVYPQENLSIQCERRESNPRLNDAVRMIAEQANHIGQLQYIARVSAGTARELSDSLERAGKTF